MPTYKLTLTINFGDLVVGDVIETKDGRNVTVKSLTLTDKQEDAYNITVDEVHTYYVTERNVLVHNCGGGITNGLSLVDQTALSADKQRTILRSAMGSNGTGKIAHHVVPLEALKRFPDLMKKAAQGGFNINGRNNGALLNRTDHVGGHPIYNKAVMEQLGRISPNLSPARTAKELQKVSNTLQNAIKQGTYGPWG